MKLRNLLALTLILTGAWVAFADPVAQIGSTTYETLDEALAAAQAMTSPVVELTADTTLSTQVVVTASATLRGATGTTLTLKNVGFTVKDGAEFVVDGLSLTRSNNNGTASLFTVMNNSSLVMTNGTSVADVSLKAGYYIVDVTSGSLTLVDGVSLSGLSSRGSTARAIKLASGTVLRVGGDVTVAGNTANGKASDVYLNDNATIEVISDLTGSIGLVSGATNAVFATVASGVDAASAAKVFFVDNDDTLEASADGQSLVWAAVAEDSGVVDPSDPTALVTVTTASGETTYDSLSKAAAAIDGAATLTLLKDATLDESIGFSENTVLDGAGFTLSRSGSARLAATNCTLMVTNAVLSGGSMRFIDVSGGTLELNAGTTVTGVTGSGRGAVAAIVVSGGTFRMNPGVTIENCVNSYQRSPGDALTAGGVLVDQDSEAYLSGTAENPSTITGCQGSGAGGVYIGNKSTVQVSGTVSITGNTSLSGEPSNLVVHDLSATTITGALDAGDRQIGFTEGISANTNVVGEITATMSDTEKIATARTFEHDTNGDIGAAVESGSTTLVVWSSAVSPEGTYTETNDVVYTLVTTDELLSAEKPTALEGLVYSGAEQVGVAGGLGYVVTGGVATNAGEYAATVSLRAGYQWSDGSTDDLTLAWSIAKAVYDMSGVTFEDKSFPCNKSTPRSISVEGLPEGVTASYEGNGEIGPGTFTVTATFSGDSDNYEAIDPATMTATMYIGVDPDDPDDPDPTPVTCEPFAFTAIEQLSDGSWHLTLAPGTTYCVYTLLTSDDLVTWTQVGDPLTLEPDTAFEFTVDGGEAKRFWKVSGEDGVEPSDD